jgi:hypothetical protein
MKLFRYRKLAFGRAIRLTGHQPRNMERSDRRAEMRLFRMLRWKWRGLPRQVVQVPLKYALEEVSNSSGLWTHLESDDLGDSWPPKFPRKRRRSVSCNMHSSWGFDISTQLLPMHTVKRDSGRCWDEAAQDDLKSARARIVYSSSSRKGSYRCPPAGRPPSGDDPARG